MPRPSLTDEIMRLIYSHEELFIHYHREYPVGTAWQAIREAAGKRRRVRESLDAIKSRLSALEQELEGYRKESRRALQAGYLRLEAENLELAAQLSDALDEIARSTRDRDEARRELATYQTPPERLRRLAAKIRARQAQAKAKLLDTIQCGNEVIARSDKPVTLEDMGFQRTIPTAALPCPSEYLSAQTGFNGEEGG